MTTMKIQVRQVSASTSEATLRTHHVLIDRPVEKGGTDKGSHGRRSLPCVGGRLLHEQPAGGDPGPWRANL